MGIPRTPRTRRKDASAGRYSQATIMSSSRRTYRQCSPSYDPLTFQRVHQASKAAGALFGWCVATIVDATKTPDLESRAVQPPPPSPPHPSLPAPSLALPPQESVVKTAPIREVKESQPKPVEKLPRAHMVPIATHPDRHFETLISFDPGSCAFDEMEPTLQRVAATMCMRRSLRLQLLGCPMRIEHLATSEGRIKACGAFFSQQGLTWQRSSERPRVANNDSTPGVICQVFLDEDRELRDFFILSESGERMELSGHTRCVIEDLRNDFQTVRH